MKQYAPIYGKYMVSARCPHLIETRPEDTLILWCKFYDELLFALLLKNFSSESLTMSKSLKGLLRYFNNISDIFGYHWEMKSMHLNKLLLMAALHFVLMFGLMYSMVG